MLENLPAVRAAVSGSLDPITDMRTIARDPAGLRYRLLFERNVDGILLAASGGRVLDANIAACNLLLIPRDELSRGIVSVPEPSRQTIEYAVRMVQRAGRFRGRLPLTRRDNKQISVEAYCTAYRTEDGMEQVCFAFHEVVGVASGEDPLFQLAPVLESANEAIIAMTLEGDILTWNSGAEQLFGLPATRMKGKRIYDVVPGELHREMQGLFKKIVHGKYARSLEMDYLRNDGQGMHLSLALSPINDEVGRVVGVSCIAHDVTNRKQKEQVLEQAEREYRGLFEHAQDAILIIEPEGEVILDVNERACDLYGFSRAELIGMSIESLSHDPDYDKTQIEQALSTGTNRRFQAKQFRRDGTLLEVDISAAVVKYRGRQAVLSINRDITEFVRLENALREMAIRDELTRLYNRREMSRLLTDEIERCRRYNREMSLLMIDIDWFKRVNDTHGHQAGDEVLQGIARLLVEKTRATDHVARYGGEEMAVILPETSPEHALVVAEHLRCQVAEHEFAVSAGTAQEGAEPLKLSVTISLGLASFSAEFNTEEAILVAADRALYEAKRRGRNCAVPFSRKMLQTKELDEANSHPRTGG
ncbi:MAG: diguanylate cyclase [Chloroflexota bacterium]|nr:diguanylate cyclase [Chloroflexota bacterium]MDQ5866944.1 diguanylate cyclase [Chloroflexota bacterium]